MQNTSIIFYLFDSLIRESHKSINSVKGHKEEDLITGRFVEIVFTKLSQVMAHLHNLT